MISSKHQEKFTGRMEGSGLLTTLGAVTGLTFCQSLMAFRGIISFAKLVISFPRFRSLAKARRAIQTAFGLQER